MRRDGWISRKLPSAESLKSSRLLRPFMRHLHHHYLWQLNRRGVAGGVAVGLFFGILIPVLQILFAAIAAVVLRVNLPVAAASTLVTNPLTFPGVYYLAYRVGRLVIGGPEALEEEIPPEVDAGLAQATEIQQAAAQHWLAGLLDWVQSIGLPLIIGLPILAAVSALLGYVGVNLAWRLRTHMRWQRRRR